MSSSHTAPSPYRLQPYCVGPHFFPNASALQPQFPPTRRMTASSALTLLCPRGSEPLSSSATSTHPRRHRGSPAADTPASSSFAPLPTSIPPHAVDDRLVCVDIDMPSRCPRRHGAHDLDSSARLSSFPTADAPTPSRSTLTFQAHLLLHASSVTTAHGRSNRRWQSR
jgi:hypothetical protein